MDDSVSNPSQDHEVISDSINNNNNKSFFNKNNNLSNQS